MKKRLLTILVLIAIVLSLFSGISTVSADDEYNGKPFKSITLPGDVRMSDFDEGENGVAYSKTAASTVTATYREHPYMQIYDMNNGLAFIGFNSGVWFKYTVNVSKTGDYLMELEYASPVGPLEFAVFLDDVQVVSAALDTTQDYTKTEVADLGIISLKQGKHVLTFKQIKGGINAHKVAFSNVKSANDIFDFSKKTGSYRSNMFPGIIEAEDFDLGSDAKHSIDGKDPI